MCWINLTLAYGYPNDTEVYAPFLDATSVVFSVGEFGCGMPPELLILHSFQTIEIAMKIVKKVLIGLGVFIIILVAAAIIIPVVFKDDIKAAIDKEIAKSVNADVLFDVNNFDLTLFRNFPNITIEVRELGVFNRAPFEGVHSL